MSRLDGKTSETIASFLFEETLTSPEKATIKGLIDLGNVDNTSDANKPVSTAQQTALDDKELLQIPHAATASAIRSYISRDRFAGSLVTATDNVTLTSDISGTLKTVSFTLGTNDVWSKKDGSLVMHNPGSALGFKDGATVPHTSGFTGIAYVRVDNAKTGGAKIGFTSSANLTSGFYRIWQGVTVGTYGGGLGNSVKGFTSTLGAMLDGELMGGLKDGDVIGIAMQLTASGFDIWMQGGPCDVWGAAAGTAAWVKIWEYTGGTIAGNLAFAVETINGAGPACVMEFATTDAFLPDERKVKSIYRSDVKYNTHASNAHYDRSGNLWTAWWAGLSPDAEATGTTYLRVRTASGIWSAVTQIDGGYAPGSGLQGDAGSFIEMADGSMWLVKQRSTDAEVTYTMYRVPVSVTAAGVVSVGTPIGFPGVTQPFILNYQHPVIRPSGRIILPCNVLNKWLVIYSDDNGATWTESPLYGGAGGPEIYGTETAVVEEGSSRRLAAYVRRGASGAGVYTPTPRYISDDEGATWQESGSIAVPSCDSRAQGIRLNNGLVAYIANDSQTSYIRENTTIWLLGDGGVTVGKIPVYVDAGGGQNYPSITARGESVAAVMPVRENSASISPAQVFVIEQTLSEWGFNARKRFSQNWGVTGAEALASSNATDSTSTKTGAIRTLGGAGIAKNLYVGQTINAAGAITGASYNGNTITTGTGTLTLGAGKTLTNSNTLTLTATDGSTLAIGAGGTLGTNAYKAAPLTATAVLDFGSIAAATTADLTISVPGAVVGYSVALGLPATPTANIGWLAWVSAPDTVTLRARNLNAVTAVDPDSATYRVTVFVP